MAVVAFPTSSTALIRYDAMCQAIAEAYKVDEVKDIRDKAAALEHYSRQANNVEAERQCCEIRLRAERKAGELLRAMEKAKGGDHTPSRDTTGTLASLGITRDQSSQWQRLAGVPEAEFEAALAGADKPTLNNILSTNYPIPIKPVSDEALWLWGRLRDFERLELLQMTATDILSTMTPQMLTDVRESVSEVISWLCNVEKECGR